MKSTRVKIEGVSARYGANEVLRELSLEIEAGELVTLLGPSGCGKTTLLKILAGLLEPSTGEILFNDLKIDGVPAERRGAVMVFQKPLLFPYLSVAENVAFGLKMRGAPAAEIRDRVGEALRWVQLEGYEKRRPSEISGGQEQRVSLARALVTEPRVLLLDEPFSALDENLRAEMRSLVRELQQRLRITTVFVTHDQLEASVLADRIAVLLAGKLEQVGRPRDFYSAPATVAVARFFGWQVVERGASVVAFRPERAGLSQSDSSESAWTGTIVSIADLGMRVRYGVRLEGGGVVDVEEEAIDSTRNFAVGERVRLELPPDGVRVFGG